MGNRIVKRVIPKNPDGTKNMTAIKTTYYVRDAQSNIMASYTQTNTQEIALEEQPIYGSSRLGVYHPTTETGIVRGNRIYEGSNHLGNVLVTFSDRIVFENGDLKPATASYSDYYAFGMPIKTRTNAARLYKSGFNGQMKDDEIYGEGNVYSAEFWEYDARLGRRWNLDPVVKPWQSGYSCFSGNPIFFIDPNGDTEYYYKGTWIGTDGIENGLIGIVHSDGLKKEILTQTKIGKTYIVKDITHGFENSNMLVLHKTVLQESVNVLQRDIDNKLVQEEWSTMEKNADGTYKVANSGQGDVVDLANANQATAKIIGGDISIHSHPTEEIKNEETGKGSYSPMDPGPKDPALFKNRSMNIIVGKEGKLEVYENKDAQGKKIEENSGKFYFNTRQLAIHIYNKGQSTKFISVSKGNAEEMLKGPKGKNYEMYKKNKK